MATIFTCEHCDRLLSVPTDRPGAVICPYCRRRTKIPAALADLPSPRVPGRRFPSPADDDAPQPEPASSADSSVVMRRIAAAMPWVISAAVHVAVGLILMALVFIVISPADARAIPPPTVSVTSSIKPTFVQSGRRQDGRNNPKPQPTRPFSGREWAPSRLTPRPTQPDQPVIGIVGPISQSGRSGLNGPDDGDNGERLVRFVGTEASASNVVFVVDRSGSMHKTFGIVRRAIQDSISEMRWDPMARPDETAPVRQAFHVILFADGDPIEHDAMRLIPATLDNKADACAFIHTVEPGGQTDPIPALQRAFRVLTGADPDRPGRVIFLLTDGDFPDNQNVLDTVTRLNRSGDIMINTILFGHRSPEAQQVMQRIAGESGGRYNFIGLDQIQGDLR